jgi:hypothetical protein
MVESEPPSDLLRLCRDGDEAPMDPGCAQLAGRDRVALIAMSAFAQMFRERGTGAVEAHAKRAGAAVEDGRGLGAVHPVPGDEPKDLALVAVESRERPDDLAPLREEVGGIATHLERLRFDLPRKRPKRRADRRWLAITFRQTPASHAPAASGMSARRRHAIPNVSASTSSTAERLSIRRNAKRRRSA